MLFPKASRPTSVTVLLLLLLLLGIAVQTWAKEGPLFSERSNTVITPHPNLELPLIDSNLELPLIEFSDCQASMPPVLTSVNGAGEISLLEVPTARYIY